MMEDEFISDTNSTNSLPVLMFFLNVTMFL